MFFIWQTDWEAQKKPFLTSRVKFQETRFRRRPVQPISSAYATSKDSRLRRRTGQPIRAGVRGQASKIGGKQCRQEQQGAVYLLLGPPAAYIRVRPHALPSVTLRLLDTERCKREWGPLASRGALTLPPVMGPWHPRHHLLQCLVRPNILKAKKPAKQGSWWCGWWVCIPQGIQQRRERAPEAEDGGERDRGGVGQVQDHRTSYTSSSMSFVFFPTCKKRL